MKKNKIFNKKKSSIYIKIYIKTKKQKQIFFLFCKAETNQQTISITTYFFKLLISY